MSDLNYTPESRGTIRDRILTYLKARHSADGRDILTIRGSYEYKKADVYALELAQFGHRLASFLTQFLPDRASGEILTRYGSVNGVDREQAVAAVFVATGTGTPSSTITPGTSLLRSSSGYLYKLLGTSFNTNGGGVWTATFVAQNAGLASNPIVGATMQWDSVPANSNPLSTVSSVTTPGADIESETDYAKRIIDTIRERPASGNRSDVRSWANTVTGVFSSFVYPLRLPAVAGESLGCFTIVPVGPPDGDTPVYPTHPRLLNLTKINQVIGYIEGTNDADGNAVAGKQLRHVGMKPTNMSVVQGTAESLDVTLTIETSPDADFEYTGAPLVLSGVSTISTFTSAGNHSVLLGKRVQVHVGVQYARGGYVTRTVVGASYNGISTLITLDSPLPIAGSNDSFGSILYGIPANWSLIKSKMFAYFDTFGPNGNGRWPNDVTEPTEFSQSSSIAAVMSVAGSKEVTVSTSGVTSPTLEFGVVTLRLLRVLRA